MPLDIRIRFGRAIRRIREEQNINQEEAAERSGLHRTYYSGIERGVRNLSLVNIEKVAKGLKKSLPDLFKRVWRQRIVFGRRIRELREERKISQEKLAELAQLHRNYVGGIERGERNVSLLNIVKLAHGLNVRPTKLVEAIR
jgi:transcriptional regulator with XRE-family HTH domain